MKLLVYGDIGGSGGYVRYCRGLFGMGSVPEDLEVYFVCARKLIEKLGPLDHGVTVIASSLPGSSSRIHRYLWHLIFYPNLVRRVQPAVEFYPLGQIRVFMRQATTVTTCHNLLLFDDNEISKYGDDVEGRIMKRSRVAQARSFRQANGVIFLSEHSRDKVSEKVDGIKESVVIPHGLDEKFRCVEERSYARSEVINLLYVSTILYYKHQAEAVKAVAEIQRESGLNLRLRLVGGASPTAMARLLETIRTERAGGFVSIYGETSDAALHDFYRESDIFLFASSCETFGITLLEAMGMRLPIACSSRSGLPLLLKDGGVYFDPESISSIKSAIKRLIESASLRHKYGSIAFDNAKDYTWQRTAHKTFEFIRRLNRSKNRAT